MTKTEKKVHIKAYIAQNHDSDVKAKKLRKLDLFDFKQFQFGTDKITVDKSCKIAFPIPKNEVDKSKQILNNYLKFSDDSIEKEKLKIIEIGDDDDYDEVRKRELNKFEDYITIRKSEHEDRFYLMAGSRQKGEKNLFVKKNTYRLQVGNIIKAGGALFEVISISGRNRAHSESFSLKSSVDVLDVTEQVSSLRETIKKRTEREGAEQVESEIYCRFCFSTDISPDPVENLLFSPCKCSGDSNLIHKVCLSSWLEKLIKLETKRDSNPNVMFYKFESCKCKVCQQNFPIMIRYKEQLIQLTSFSIPKDKEMMILKKSKYGQEDSTKFNIYILFTRENRIFKVGRKINQDIIIDNPTISMCHFKIYCRGDQIELEDNNSKFGTLRMLRQNLEIIQKPFAVQANNIVFKIWCE